MTLILILVLMLAMKRVEGRVYLIDWDKKRLRFKDHP